MGPHVPEPRKLAGRLLVAAPTLLDPNFRQTVVYLVDHDPRGAFGLVMNRPAGKRLSDAMPQVPLPERLAQVPVYSGGPVQADKLFLAVFRPAPSGREMKCRLDTPIEQAEALIEKGDGWVRAFAGYSGWGEGQLDNELAEQAWRVCRPDPALFDERFTQGLWSVYVSGDDRWRRLVPFLPLDPETN